MLSFLLTPLLFFSILSYGTEFDCREAVVSFTGKFDKSAEGVIVREDGVGFFDQSARVKLPDNNFHKPLMKTVDSDTGQIITTEICVEYKSLTSYSSCLMTYYRKIRESNHIQTISNCSPGKRASIKNASIKKTCDNWFPKKTKKEFDEIYDNAKSDWSNFKNYLVETLYINGCNIGKGCKLNVPDCKKLPPGEELFGATDSGGFTRPAYLDCPLEENLPIVCPNNAGTENHSGEGSPLNELESEIIKLRKKSDRKMKTEYANLLRLEAFRQVMDSYYQEFGSEAEFPGDLSDKSNVCNNQRFRKSFHKIKSKPKTKTPSSKKDLSDACKLIIKQITGDGDKSLCAEGDDSCGSTGRTSKAEHLHLYSEHERDHYKGLRRDAILGSIKTNPVASSLYDNGDIFNLDSFPKCKEIHESKGKVNDDDFKGLRDKAKENFKTALQTLCHPDQYPNSYLYSDPNLVAKINSDPNSPYRPFQACIEQDMSNRDVFASDIVSVLGGAGFLVGAFFPPAGLALTGAAAAMGAGLNAQKIARGEAQNSLGLISGDIEEVAKRNDDADAAVLSTTLDVVTTVGAPAKAGKHIVKGLGYFGDIRTISLTHKWAYDKIAFDKNGRPEENEIYDMDRKSKEKVFKRAPINDQFFVSGFGNERAAANKKVDSVFGTNKSNRLSDLEAIQLCLISQRFDKLPSSKKTYIKQVFKTADENDVLSAVTILRLCRLGGANCPKDNSQLVTEKGSCK